MSVENLNMDLDKLLCIDVDALPWRPSPGGDVDRRMLEREHRETGRTTSVVRYPAGSRFPAHTHGGGEEILVLEGTFSDEHGDYPAGSYLRNPVGSSHAPFSEDGCVIFVKLWQMRPEETETLVASADRHLVMTSHGLQRQVLHQDTLETVELLWADRPSHIVVNNAEVLVLAGDCQIGTERATRLTWLRVPRGQSLQITMGAGSHLWVKQAT